jgi:AraC-like DNA-binding protein
MVSRRCKMMVEQELNNIGLKYKSIELGYVELAKPITKEKREELKLNLLKSGLILIEDHKSILVERIKNVITDMIHNAEDLPHSNYSDYISAKLGLDYTYLANTFSEVKGITIQHYIIENKIERVKELILYHEYNLTEIANIMHYSSVAHLSNQFKKVTGISPSAYMTLNLKRTQNLENL